MDSGCPRIEPNALQHGPVTARIIVPVLQARSASCRIAKGSPAPLPLPRARDEAHSQRRARAFPAGSGLATAARREPGLPGPPHRPAPPYTLRYPCLPPPCPGWPAQLAPCGADRKQRGQGRAGRWPVAMAGLAIFDQKKSNRRNHAHQHRLLNLF